MSWIQDEWKESLSADARSHITSMEESLDKLQNDISQYHFKTESLSSTIDNLNEKLNEKEVELKRSERELIALQSTLDDECNKNKDLDAQIKNRDDLIHSLNTQIENLKSKQEQIGNEDEVEIDQQQHSEEDTNDLLEQINGKDQLIEELSEEIEKLKCVIETNHSETNSQSDMEEVISSHNEISAGLEHQLALLHKDKTNWEEKANYFEKELEKTKELFEKNNAGESTNENNEHKSKSNHLGNYLGINMTRSSSDSRIKTNNYALLEEENKKLTSELKNMKNEHVLLRMNSDVLQSGGNSKNNIDSGVSLSVHSQELVEELELKQNEIEKLKIENKEMNDVYVSHMKICKAVVERENSTPQRYTIERSQSQPDCDRVSRTKSDALTSLQSNVRTGFDHLAEKYNDLEKKLSDISTTLGSNNIHTKIERIATLITKERSGEGAALPGDWNRELEHLKADIFSNFLTVQDEVHKGSQETREEIKTATKVIIDYVQQNDRQSERNNHVMDEERYQNVSSRRKGRAYDEKSTIMGDILHMGTSNSIAELETIKERLGNVQHSISESNNEKRKIENERDRIQSELVKMVDTLKRKEEEIGRVTRLYDEEKQKLDENDACYRTEMEELQREQLEIYEEFRQMCETLKRKDIELSNKSKQIKLLTAESREKEDELRHKISSLESDNTQLHGEKEEITKQYNEKRCECEALLKKFIHSSEQIETIFSNLSRVEKACVKAKSHGLYK